MLTAAVRDLHRCQPGRFVTDVRTPCPELWENNPFLTPMREDDPSVATMDCHYPLIQRSNQAPFHFLHGFTRFLSERLRLPIVPTEFRGDIHLRQAEMSSDLSAFGLQPSALPYWLLVAGGKSDFTIKWWAPDRWQAVVDHFQGKIQFAQVGAAEHHHPALSGVIDLRGKTSLRDLIRLVYHSQGVLTPVSLLMHLAAAVPLRPSSLDSRPKPSPLRPCVVVAGGREPAHWEAYPGH